MMRHRARVPGRVRAGVRRMAGIRLLAVGAGVLGLLLPVSSAPGSAAEADATTTITFADFSDLSTMQLNGNTATNGNPVTNTEGAKVLRLTTGLSQAGSAFLREAIPLVDDTGFKASFSTAFEFQITKPVGCSDGDGQGADGIVFAVQTVSNTAGGAGFGIGYYGLKRSVGVEFDTWYNGASLGDPNGNHVAIDTNGTFDGPATPVAQRMNDGAVWRAWVDYNGETQQLDLRLVRRGTSSDPVPLRPDAALASRTVDLPQILQTSEAYVGFTSGTGCAGGDHDILWWQFTNTYAPINTPPVAYDGTATVPEDTPTTIELVATDEGDDALTYELVDDPVHGAVTVSGSTALYTPSADYHGPDSFTFKARDAVSESNVATVSLDVVAAPLIPTALAPHPLVVSVLPTEVYLRFGATLTSEVSGDGVPGQTVVFSTGTAPACVATTDTTGYATCTVEAGSLLTALEEGGYDAVYDGDPDHLPSAAHGSLIIVTTTSVM